MLITGQLLEKLTGGAAKDSYVNEIAAAITEEAPQYGVDTVEEMAIFLGQGAHETGGFRLLYEGWGPTKAQLGYEGRDDLGNTQKGDGYKFRGRGIFQLTGRANYRAMGKKIGIDLEKNPDKAADPAISVKIAFEYWKSRNMNAVIAQNPKDPVLAVSIKVNGRNRKTGLPNGLADRRAYTTKARKLLGGLQRASLLGGGLDTPREPEATSAPDFEPPETIVTAESPEELIASLQKILVKKNYGKLNPDGKWGQLTELAILALQKENGLDLNGEAISIEDADAAKVFLPESRKDATIEDVRKSDTEKAAKINKATAVKIAGGAATALPIGEKTGFFDMVGGWVDHVTGISGAIQPIMGPLAAVGAWAADNLWLVLPATGALAVILARNMQFNVLDAFKKGD